jgi:hypothetical protein
MDLRIGSVSTTCPRLSVQTPPRSDVVLANVLLLIRRVGDAADFASYTPINIVGSVLQFQFDALLFDGLYGRYAGTLSYLGNPYASLQFQFVPDVSINPALQLSTTGPYQVTTTFADPNWSGTGIGGPGTFIGLKDCPKTYAGAAGQTASVNATETGMVFAPFAVTVYAAGKLPLAPPTNGVLVVHADLGGGLAYSFGGQWVDVRTQTVVS